MKLLLLALIVSPVAYSKTVPFELEEKRKVTITHPEGWETAKGLYSLPVTVLGPFANNSRPVLSVVPTGIKEDKDSQKELQKLLGNFKSAKEEWITGHKGALLKYEAVTEVSPRKDLKGHFVGAEFLLNGITFIERSYYLFCKGEVYNLKYSIRDEHRKYLNDLQKIVGEFKCE